MLGLAASRDLFEINQNATLIWDLHDDGDNNYTNGGDDWEGTCSTGTSQSPIDLEISDLADLETAYYNREFPNIDGDEIQYLNGKLDTFYDEGIVNYTIKGETSQWQTQQFHFHAPSEHMINGEHEEAEMHFRCVRPDDNTTYLQFAILLDLDDSVEDNEFFEQLRISEFEVNSTEVQQSFELTNVNVSLIFDEVKNSNILKYEGSRTRPPCQEDTVWLVLRNTFKINQKQLTYFTRLWADNPDFAGGRGNNRNIQERNGRDIYLLTRDDVSKYH